MGTRIAIHAAARSPSSVESLVTPELDRLCSRLHGADWRRTLKRSVVVCTAVIGESIPTEAIAGEVHPDDLAAGIWTPGRWAWPLLDVATLPDVPARGAQGLWRWSPSDGADLRIDQA